MDGKERPDHRTAEERECTCFRLVAGQTEHAGYCALATDEVKAAFEAPTNDPTLENLREQVQQPQEVREAREIFTRSVESTFSLEAFLAALQDLQEAAGTHPDISSTAAYWRGRTRNAERAVDRMREKLAAIQARLESGKSYRLAEDIQVILGGEVPVEVPVEVNPNAGLAAWADRYMAERGIEPTPEGQSLADRVARGEA